MAEPMRPTPLYEDVQDFPTGSAQGWQAERAAPMSTTEAAAVLGIAVSSLRRKLAAAAKAHPGQAEVRGSAADGEFTARKVLRRGRSCWEIELVQKRNEAASIAAVRDLRSTIAPEPSPAQRRRWWRAMLGRSA
jgi:hypothetical protein